ncbi:MAG TPA: carbohydrate-binding protein [Cyclobacteriaceae bacterium]
MKIIKYVLFIFFGMLCALSVQAQNWQLVWSDEFTSGISSDWVFETGTGSGGWGNNELEYYRQQNATVSNGQLVITAKHESYGGMNYTSARMKTQGKKSWKFGKIEARIAMPSFQGIWPAFWMLGDNIGSVGWPACGELDIMEHINTGGTVYGTAHWSDNNNAYASYGGNTTTTVTAFHNYSIEWNTSYVRWFVDGVKYHEINIAGGVNGTSEFQNNFFILLNLAVGGNWPGFTIDNNGFPASMYVDYVRVYQDAGTSFTQTVQAESYSSMLGVQTETTTDTGGGLDVGWIDTNDWMAYNNITVPTTGSYLLEYRVASVGGGTLSADLNAGSIVLGTVSIPATGGWQNWTTVSKTVTINAGTYNFGIFAAAGGWNLNWWRITKQGAGRLSTPEETVALKEESKFDIYPNPATTELNIISSEEAQKKVRITGSNGAEVFNGRAFNGKVDISNLPNGMYIIHAVDNGKSFNKKFLKKQ